MMLRSCLAVLAMAMLVSCDERPKETRAKRSAEPNDAAVADSTLYRELFEFERAWVAASTARDSAALNRAIADEWTITLSDGRQSNKERAIKRWTAPLAGGVLRDTAIVYSIHVRRLSGGAAAIVASIIDIEFFAQRAETTRTRVTDVVVRRDGRWQTVVSHESIVQEKPE